MERARVCGLQVGPRNAVATVDHRGKIHRFCREDRHHRFAQEPRRCARQGTGP